MYIMYKGSYVNEATSHACTANVHQEWVADVHAFAVYLEALPNANVHYADLVLIDASKGYVPGNLRFDITSRSYGWTFG